MAIVNVSSGVVTNADASPPVQNPSTFSGAPRRSIIGTVELASGDSINSVYRIARVRSHWRICELRLYCDAITSAAADVGLAQTAANGGAVLLATAYGSAVSIATAITVGTNVAFEARDIATAVQRVYQDGGLTTDPQVSYDLILKLTAATTAAGTVTLEVIYTED